MTSTLIEIVRSVLRGLDARHSMFYSFFSMFGLHSTRRRQPLSACHAFVTSFTPAHTASLSVVCCVSGQIFKVLNVCKVEGA